MRIAIVTGVFPRISETFVLHHINGLLHLGHDVDVYAEHRPRDFEAVRDDALATAIQPRTVYVDVPSLRTGRRLLATPSRLVYCARAVPRLTLAALNPAKFGRYTLDLSQMNRLYSLARLHRRADVIHAHFGMVGDRFRFAAPLWQAPLVVSFHGFDATVWPQEHGMDCYRHMFREASAIIVNSENTRRRVAELGCPPQKIETIYPAWDMDNFPYAIHQREEGQPFRVLTVARLVEIKGVEDAIRAVALVRKTHPDIHYDIVGDGPLRPKLEALIDTLGLRENVTLHGAQSREFVRRMTEDAHVFLLSSAKTPGGAEEGLGVVLLEAQAAGLPVVATEHGAFPEVVAHGETGFLAPERSPEKLAEWLSYLIEHPQVADQMGRSAREHVERHFAPQQIYTRCEEVYQRVIAEFPAQRPARPARQGLGVTQSS